MHIWIWAISPVPFFLADLLKISQIWWERLWTASSGLSLDVLWGSRLRQSHSQTCRDLSRSHSNIVLAACFGSLSCYKVTFFVPLLRLCARCSRFSRASLYLAAFNRFSILTSFAVPAAENPSRSITLPPSYFTIGMVLAVRWTEFSPDVVFWSPKCSIFSPD